MNRILLFICLGIFVNIVFGQEKTAPSQNTLAKKDSAIAMPDIALKPDSSIPVTIIVIDYAYQIPDGDLAKRFKNNSSLGGGVTYKTRENLLFGGEVHFIFGGKPKESGVLDSILTNSGDIIDASGQIADVRMYERGYNMELKAGKIFPMRNMNKNSGWFVTAGVGFLQHKIRIESIGNKSPQLSKEYVKGYDRLANGILLSQAAGFFFMSEKRLTNFFAAFELNEGFTQGRRYNYDSMQLDNKKRTDLFIGLRFGWMIPLNSKAPDDFYYF